MALVLLGAVVFFGVASVIKPPPRGASASGSGTSTSQNLGTIAPNANLQPSDSPKLIGTLEGSEFRVWCFSTPEGPRYRVQTLAGEIRGDGLSAQDMSARFPQIDLGNLQAVPNGADAGSPVMVHDE